jgi:hypothetical protein
LSRTPDSGVKKAPGLDPQHLLGAYPLAANACTRNWQLQLYTGGEGRPLADRVADAELLYSQFVYGTDSEALHAS